MEERRNLRKPRLIPAAALIVGLLLLLHGCGMITPKSVPVSSYYRSDGTYVGSYERRPPNSSGHDYPYETEWKFGLFLSLIGGWALRSMRHSRRSTPPQVYISAPKSEPIILMVPTLYDHPEAGTRCSDCTNALIGTENAFYHLLEGERVFICTECRDKRIRARRSMAQ